jgi:hypothetical protein
VKATRDALPGQLRAPEARSRSPGCDLLGVPRILAHRSRCSRVMVRAASARSLRSITKLGSTLGLAHEDRAGMSLQRKPVGAQDNAPTSVMRFSVNGRRSAGTRAPCAGYRR